MCLPFLIPAAGAAAGAAGAGAAAVGGLSTLSTIATIASAGLGVVGALQQASAASAAAKTQQTQYEQQAAFQDRQANLEQTQGGYEARRRRERLEGLTAQQRGQFAAAGVTLDGSPTDVILDTRSEGELDLAAVRFGTDLKTDNLRYTAGVSRQNALSAGAAADTAWLTGGINALAPIIGLGRNDRLITTLGLNF